MPTAETAAPTTTTTDSASPESSGTLHICDSWKSVPGTGKQECAKHGFVRSIRFALRTRKLMPAGEIR